MNVVSAYLMSSSLSKSAAENMLTDYQLNLGNWTSANVVGSMVRNTYFNDLNYVTVDNSYVVPPTYPGPDGNLYEYYYHINWVASSSVTLDEYIWSHGKLAGWTNGGNGGMGYAVCYDPTYQNYLGTISTNNSNGIWICQLYRNGQLDTLGHYSVPAIGVTSSDITFYSANAEECVDYLLNPGHKYPRLYTAVATEVGTRYLFKAFVCSPTGFSCSGAYGGYDKEWIAVMDEAPFENVPLREYQGTFVEISQDASSTLTEYDVSFMATAPATYFVFDFGQINENVEVTFNVKVELYEVE